MSNTDTPNEETPRGEGEPLARLTPGGEAGGLQVRGSQPASHRKKATPRGEGEQLERPRGALVAMRKSGGLLFSWRLLVVHRDGRLIYKSNEVGAPAEARVIGRLNDSHLAELQALIGQTDWSARSIGRDLPNPDAFGYELIARVGRKNEAAELFEGRIPATFKPLIARLNQMLPSAPPEEKPSAEDE